MTPTGPGPNGDSAPGAREGAGGAAPTVKPSAGGALKILLVEDNPDDAALFARALKGRPVEVRVAERLGEALARLDAGGFDLVVTDLSLPDSDGAATFQRLKGKAPHLPLLVLTGRNDEALGLSMVRQGAEDYLLKGELAGALLYRALLHALERKRSREELARIAQALGEQNDQLLADLEMARDVQQALLPRAPRFTFGRVRLHYRFLPTSPVGGDLFTLVPSATDETTLAVFDVMGHGVRAALVASLLRAVVSELPFKSHDPAALLAHLSDRLRAIFNQQPVLATACCLTLNPAAGTLKVACAGHPPPLHLRPEERQVAALEVVVGPPLGLLEGPEYSTRARDVESGDLVLLFTDGVYEVADAEGALLGKGGLDALVREHVRVAAADLADAVLASVRHFTGAQDFEDDVCLVVAELCA